MVIPIVEKHGKTNTRIYNIWCKMKQRCNYESNDNYKWYGGKGIQVCEEWMESFQSFYDWSMVNGYKKNLTLDRIDNTKNYSPGNCRWMTHKAQCSNRTSNRKVTIKGITKTVQQWSDFSGLKYGTIYYRVINNWNESDILKVVT